MNQKNGRTDPGPLRERARSLFISQATIDETLEWATPRQLDAIDRMLATELANREASKRARLMRQARFPVPKSLDGYDFANVRLPDGYTKEQLTGLDFAAKAQDLVFYGKTGRGKTHLATALGMLAIEQGRSVRFRQTAELVLQLGKAKRDGALDSLLRDLARADLIILDEFGYAPVRLDGARLLYQIIAGSYERRSIILRHEHRVQQMGDDLRRRQTRRRDHRPHRPPRTPHRIHRPQPTRQPSPHVRQDGQPVKQTTGRHSSCRKPKKISDETRNTDLTKNTSCMSGTTNVESSVEGKSIRGAAAKLLLLVSNQDYGFQRPVCCRYTKEECARTHRTRMPDCVPPCRSNPFFADWIPGPIPWPISADRLADGARVELARDFRPNSLSRTAPLPHGPPSMPVFAIQGHTG